MNPWMSSCTQETHGNPLAEDGMICQLLFKSLGALLLLLERDVLREGSHGSTKLPDKKILRASGRPHDARSSVQNATQGDEHREEKRLETLQTNRDNNNI